MEYTICIDLPAKISRNSLSLHSPCSPDDDFVQLVKTRKIEQKIKQYMFPQTLHMHINCLLHASAIRNPFATINYSSYLTPTPEGDGMGTYQDNSDDRTRNTNRHRTNQISCKLIAVERGWGLENPPPPPLNQE